MTLDDLKNWATIFGTVVGVVVASKGIIEYTQQNAIRRLELFQAMRKRFEESPAMQRVRAALEADKEDAVTSLAKNDKVDFLAFYEDLALMVDSRMMRPEIAQYWFGFYVVLANEKQAFWADLNPNLPYWRVVRQFAQKMQSAEKALGQSGPTFRV
jgi:hypothetical protein